MSRDDETEPMTRMLGTIDHAHAHVSPPHEPQRRRSDPDRTRLEIARPKLASKEPETKIVHPSTFRPALSLGTETLPATPRPRPHDEVTVPRARLSVSPQDEITAPRPERRTMPLILALLLAATCIATGASLLWPRARGPKLAAGQPAAVQPVQPAVPAPAPGVSVLTDTPATQPVEAAPEPSAPIDAGVIAELERRALDRLRDNDHPGALALYRELTSVAATQPAYPVMVSLLERRLRDCQGGPGCAR
jgi:hypothetical protein